MTDAADKKPDQRLNRKYRFDDHDMDLFFVAALGWGASGGLDIGQAFHVAATIGDGDADSWVASFSRHGGVLDARADAWAARGWRRAAGEARLQAAACYRSAWQFAAIGPEFMGMYAKERTAFAAAMADLGLPATFFAAPYRGKSLPGVFFRNPKPDAPVVLVIGGSDTGFEDLFLTVGRNLFERGFSVALADLPGQGDLASQGLTWEVAAEQPIAAIVDLLCQRFAATPGRIAMLGLSLGGYFACRAAAHERRFAAVIASTPFSRPGEMFSAAIRAATANPASKPPTSAQQRARRILMWKAGATTLEEFASRTGAMVAEPRAVTVPFLSIVGAGDSPIFIRQAEEWHAAIPSTRKSLVLLDAATGADGHCQVANRLRLAQETSGWLGEVLGW